LNKTLLSGMFSSVSDAELVTELLPVADSADYDEDIDQVDNNNLSPEVERKK